MIDVLIAAYNEGPRIGAVLDAIPPTVYGRAVRTTVVSDGSTDDTVAVARARHVDVLGLASNAGKWTAMRAGFDRLDASSTECLVTMDGDGQHAPSDLTRMVQPVLDGEADAAIGSRYVMSPGRGSTPRNRYSVRQATVWLLERLLDVRFSDPYCGYRAFSRRAMDAIDFAAPRYGGELEALFDLTQAGLTAVEVPILKVYGPGTTKMGTRGGSVIGRLGVLAEYATTLHRKHREAVARPSAGSEAAELIVP